LSRLAIITALLLLDPLVSPSTAASPAVNESARGLPLAYEVDVAVVGGGTGAISAAVAAAESGAEVFLAAPRPYLGDDMTATLRLWLEEGEKPIDPLAMEVFNDAHTTGAPDPNRIGLRYQTDMQSSVPHKDTSPPSVLTDGIWGDPIRQTVQYNGDVNITADLGDVKPIESVRMMVHYGAGPSPYQVARVTVCTSNDQQTWAEAAVVENDYRGPSGTCLELTAPIKSAARYVKFAFERTPDAKRMLLGEIEVVRPASPELEKRLAGDPMPRPMHVKRVLDEALLAAGVKFLYGCYATDVLHDAKGKLCGIVMANRAGRQAVVAKTIIDATDRARVARRAGAEFRPFPAGRHTAKRVVIGGEIREGDNMAAREVPPPFRGPYPNPAGTSSDIFPVIEYTLNLPFADDTIRSWAEADQIAREITYHHEQQFTSDALFMIPPDPVHGLVTATGDWQGVDALPLDAFRPEKVDRIWILGGCADVSRPQAEKLLRTLALTDMGKRIGRAAAGEAASLANAAGIRLRGQPTENPVETGDVKELLIGVRPVQELPTVPQDARALPVLGRYDVVVIGGGTAGAPAGIGAARQGARTLVVECLHGLGGVGTTGAISKYYYGNRVGFTAEVPGGSSWVIEQKQEWYRKELRKAGADIWFGTIGCGAFVRDNQVVGAVVASPQTRGVVLARVVIDATGNADIVAAAGAECRYIDDGEFAMQGTGLPPRQLGATYTNTDYTYTDETDLVDVWHLLVYAKQKYAAAFDLGQLVDTRERRRIVGDFTVTLLDQMAGRTYPDSIVHAMTNYDTHGYTVAPYSQLKHPLRTRFFTYLPYRCLLPQGIERMLVSGIGISAQRDAQPLVRMQPDVQNQGYAAGVAAAMSAKSGMTPRQIDIRALQSHLVDLGNLPEEVLCHEDSFPVSDADLAAAVESVRAESQGLAVILAHPDQALPLLQKAYHASEGRDKLAYAKILGMMGDATGLETLVATIRATDAWDEVPSWKIGPDYQDYRDVGWSMSKLDNTIIALGRTRQSEAVPVILEKLRILGPKSSFSHYRSVALALEMIGHSRAAAPVAELLRRPGMTGHVHLPLDQAAARDAPGEKTSELVRSAWDAANRTNAVRELALARALFRCGDHEGLARAILTQYTQDLRGHFARHAKAVLESPEK
jgi:flavin-dependent dehydrogenase